VSEQPFFKLFLEENLRSAGAAFNGQSGKPVKKLAFGTRNRESAKNHRRAQIYLDKVALLKCMPEIACC